MKITMLGTGIFGTAIAMQLAKNKDNKIVMWSESKELYQEFKETKRIASIVDIKIPSNIKITNSYEEALKDSKLIYITSASKYVEKICHNIKPYYKKSIPICIASKGIEDANHFLLSDIIQNILNTNNISVISGPTFAIDLINNEPSALALASTSRKAKNLVLDTLANETLKLRPNKDIIGVQLCGAIKNCIAIASGILSGLGYSESTQAFLINESIHDIKQVIYYLGGNPKTALSFAGLGDLILTCSSTKSRNFSLGYIIGSTKDHQKIQEYLKNNVVEGYNNIEVFYHLLEKKDIRIPIIDIMYHIIHNEQKPENLVNFLIEKE